MTTNDGSHPIQELTIENATLHLPASLWRCRDGLKVEARTPRELILEIKASAFDPPASLFQFRAQIAQRILDTDQRFVRYHSDRELVEDLILYGYLKPMP